MGPCGKQELMVDSRWGIREAEQSALHTCDAPKPGHDLITYIE